MALGNLLKGLLGQNAFGDLAGGKTLATRRKGMGGIFSKLFGQIKSKVTDLRDNPEYDAANPNIGPTKSLDTAVKPGDVGSRTRGTFASTLFGSSNRIGGLLGGNRGIDHLPDRWSGPYRPPVNTGPRPPKRGGKIPLRPRPSVTHNPKVDFGSGRPRLRRAFNTFGSVAGR